MMDTVMTKLSSYQIASSLIPGAVLIVALSYLGIRPAGTPDTAEILLFYYVSGLLMNRLGAVSALRFSDEKLKQWYLIYRDSEQGRQVFDTYALYRTLTVAMMILLVVLILRQPWDRVSGTMAALATVAGIVFGAATILQIKYLRLIQQDRQRIGRTDAGDSSSVSPPARLAGQ